MLSQVWVQGSKEFSCPGQLENLVQVSYYREIKNGDYLLARVGQKEFNDKMEKNIVVM